MLVPAEALGINGCLRTPTARSSGSTRAASITLRDRSMSTKTIATAVMSICHATNSMKRDRLRTNDVQVITSLALIIATMIRCQFTLQPSLLRNRDLDERRMLPSQLISPHPGVRAQPQSRHQRQQRKMRVKLASLPATHTRTGILQRNLYCC